MVQVWAFSLLVVNISLSVDYCKCYPGTCRLPGECGWWRPLSGEPPSWWEGWGSGWCLERCRRWSSHRSSLHLHTLRPRWLPQCPQELPATPAVFITEISPVWLPGAQSCPVSWFDQENSAHSLIVERIIYFSLNRTDRQIIQNITFSNFTTSSSSSAWVDAVIVV